MEHWLTRQLISTDQRSGLRIGTLSYPNGYCKTNITCITDLHFHTSTAVLLQFHLSLIEAGSY